MRVATYNVHRGLDLRGLRRPEATRDVIAALGADLLALQEARSWRRGRDLIGLEQLARLTGLVPVEVEGAAGWRGNVLLRRGGAKLLRAEGLRIGGWEPRGAIRAEVDLGQGPLRVIATHLSLGPATRIRQAQLLLDAMRDARDAPTLLLGDLNEWRADRGALRILEPVFGRAPQVATFPAPRPIFPLDRILGTPHRLVRSLAAHDIAPARHASDHLPLVAEVAP